MHSCLSRIPGSCHAQFHCCPCSFSLHPGVCAHTSILAPPGGILGFSFMSSSYLGLYLIYLLSSRPQNRASQVEKHLGTVCDTCTYRCVYQTHQSKAYSCFHCVYIKGWLQPTNLVLQPTNHWSHTAWRAWHWLTYSSHNLIMLILLSSTICIDETETQRYEVIHSR